MTLAMNYDASDDASNEKFSRKKKTQKECKKYWLDLYHYLVYNVIMNNTELKQLRLANNLSQFKFADAVDVLQHQVSEWERGKVQLSDKRLQKFIDTLKNKRETRNAQGN